MKKLRTMAALLLSGLLLVSVSSCKPEDDDPITQAFWEGAVHGFTDVEVLVNESVDVTSVTGNIEGGGTISLYFDATSTGTYTFGNDANLTLSMNGKYYYPGSNDIGTINVTKLDGKKRWIEMDFNGTVTNISDMNDKIDITEGVIRSTFSF